MSKLVSKFGLVTVIAIGALVAALPAAPSQAAQKRAAHSRAYDGLWSVSIYTLYGPCAAYRYPARIVGGRVVQAVNDFSYQISGAVAASGATACSRLWPATRRERSGPLERRRQSLFRHLERDSSHGSELILSPCPGMAVRRTASLRSPVPGIHADFANVKAPDWPHGLPDQVRQ